MTDSTPERRGGRAVIDDWCALLGEHGDTSDIPDTWLQDRIDAEIRAAVAAERERCAQVAESVRDAHDRDGDFLRFDAARLIAAAIRAGEEPEQP